MSLILNILTNSKQAFVVYNRGLQLFKIKKQFKIKNNNKRSQKMRIKMNNILKKTDELLETDLTKKSIKVIDNSGYTIGKIEPVAIESCMTPGTFRITPVSIKIENENIVFNNGRDELKILVKDFENGTVIVQTDEFIPQITKAKSQCTSCTNCGRCSW